MIKMVAMFDQLKFITENGYIFSDLFIRLNGIIDAMTILVDPRALSKPLLDQYNELVEYVHEYDELMDKLTPSDRQRHAKKIAKLASRCDEIKGQLVDAMKDLGIYPTEQDQDMDAEQEIPPDNEPVEMESDSANNLPETFVPSVQQEIEIMSEANSNASNVQPSIDNGLNETEEMQSDAKLNEITSQATGQGDEKMEADMSTAPMNQLPIGESDRDSDKLKAKEKKDLQLPVATIPNVIQRPGGASSINAMLSTAISNSTEFTYQSLLHYNAMFNEIVKLGPMPEQVSPEHFQQLNKFISDYLRDCIARKINLASIEAMLVSNVAASFNPEVYSNWKNQLVGGKVSLRSLKEFLYKQEEMARDRCFTHGRLVLASAIRAAQQMVQEKSQIDVRYSISASKSMNAQTEAKNTYASTVRDTQKPQCSYWSDNNGSSSKTSNPRLNTGIHPGSAMSPPSNPTMGNSGIANRDGSRNRTPNTSDHQTSSRDSSETGGDRKEPRTYVCLLCKGGHLLFYCKTYKHWDLQKRRDFVEKEGICPRCVIAKHTLAECPDRKCHQCRRLGQPDDHNSTLCEISYNKKNGGEKKEK